MCRKIFFGQKMPKLTTFQFFNKNLFIFYFLRYCIRWSIRFSRKTKKEKFHFTSPKNWKREERREMKAAKKKNWYKKGGYKSVIFVPATPESELMKRFNKVVSASGIEIKLIEKSGKTLGEMLRTSDPRKERRCRRDDCPVCTTGGKGNCKTLDINYQMTCECDDQ